MSRLATPLSDRLGLRYPIVAAPMFLISNREMLRAAAAAGILGAMPSLNARTSEAFAEDLQWLRRECAGPYAINLTIGLTPAERLERDLELCFKHDVRVIITSYGDPTPIVERAHEHEVTVFHDVINLHHAKRAEAAGVDAIIGVSQGAGGHAGSVNTLVLIPYLRRHLSVPIIAAGCISRGEHLAAVFGLGAELAYVGTRFIASHECGAVDAYKNLVVDSSHNDIVYTPAVSGIHANFLRQTIPEGSAPSRDTKRWKDIWSAGQGVSLIDDIKSIEAIVDDLVAEYRQAVATIPRLEEDLD